MLLDFAHVLVPIAAVVIHVVAQVLIFRGSSRLSLLVSEFAGFGVGLAALIGLELVVLLVRVSVDLDAVGMALTNLLVYVCTSYVYFHFVSSVAGSLRVRMLLELHDAPEGLSEDDLLTRYNARLLVDGRLDRLTNNGQLVQRDGRYYLGKPRLLLVAQAFELLRWVLFGRAVDVDVDQESQRAKSATN